MKVRTVVYPFIATLLLSGCTSSNRDFPKPSGINIPALYSQAKINGSNPLTGHVQLITPGYLNKIRETAYKFGSKAALETIMNDFDRYSIDLNDYKTSQNETLYRLISTLIQETGNVDMKIHYFRNRLNVTPKSLKELLKINQRLPAKKQWRLMSVQASLYHMQGSAGEYNLKFVSWDGFCEAVYNRQGTLLTEKNDPINMGTFNYAAGIKELNTHLKYDVEPYWEWGNTHNSPQKGKDNIMAGVSKAAAQYKENEESILKYRSLIVGKKPGKV